MIYLAIGILIFLGFICVYGLVDRVCKAVEYKALTQAYAAYVARADEQQLKNVNFAKDLKKE